MAATASSFESPQAALRAAVEVVGSQSATGRLLSVSQAAVWEWLRKGKVLPAEHVLTVERETGISRHDLRPDLYPRESVEVIEGSRANA
jgi:DNA-binding transcriptional regulator YdaS (Cro superfamily)